MQFMLARFRGDCRVRAKQARIVSNIACARMVACRSAQVFNLSDPRTLWSCNQGVNLHNGKFDCDALVRGIATIRALIQDEDCITL